MRLSSVLFCFVSLHMSVAFAHEETHPKSLAVAFDEMGFDLNLSYRLSKGMQSQQMRRDMDLNRDGVLDADEQLKMKRRLVAFATFGLKVKVDGKVTVSQVDEHRIIGGSKPVNSGSSIELRIKSRYRSPWTQKAQSLEIQDYLPIRKTLIHGTCNPGRISVEKCGAFSVREGLVFQTNVRLLPLGETGVSGGGGESP